jgi:hypothetical protein
MPYLSAMIFFLFFMRIVGNIFFGEMKKVLKVKANGTVHIPSGFAGIIYGNCYCE